MIPNDQPARKQMISRMLSRLVGDTDIDLTKWEMDFIESVANQFEDKDDLSNKQCEILERLYDK